MLRNLTIRNYALIENLELEFGPGLTIITGQTGAGKSIMLGALGLVMGGRADTKVISDTGTKSVVEAVFTDIDPELETILEERGVEWATDAESNPMLTIRREVSSNGRSKIHINGTSVTLQTLGVVVPRLIDIHSQHANAKINDPSERLRIIDAFALNHKEKAAYRKVFERYLALRRKIKLLREAAQKDAAQKGVLEFQLAQLDALKPKAGELEEIEKKFEILSEAGEIKERLQLMISLLSDSRGGIGENLSEVLMLATRNPEVPGVAEEQEDDHSIASRLRAMTIETKDIRQTLEAIESDIETNPEITAKLSARMNAYYEAIRNFKVKDAEELVALYSSLKERYLNLNEEGGDLSGMEAESHILAKELKEKADILSETRRIAASRFSTAICDKARPLGLSNISFMAKVGTRKLSSEGQDEVEFLCSFNKNGTLQPVSKIASGGEISRLMLSLKTIMAGHINLPTIIFDEVDTGVSGEIADKMGQMMHSISEAMQVVAITHLPQVASQGDQHFKVFKKDLNDRTVTNVELLDHQGRIKELAAMISGSRISEAALSAATSLLDKNMANN